MSSTINGYEKSKFTLIYHDTNTENAYLDSISKTKKLQKIFVMALTFLLYSLYIALDMFILSEQAKVFFIAFHSSMLMVWTLLIPFIYYDINKKLTNYILYVIPIYATTMTLFGSYFGSVIYVTEIYIILFWIFVTVGYMFLESVIVATTMLILSATLTYIFNIFSLEQYLQHIFFMVGTWTLGFTASYMIELYSRQNYEKKMHILSIQTELKNLNLSLEQRVREEVEKNKRSQEYLQIQSRMAQMGEMISMIAHQWKQPLSAISAVAINLKLQLELNKFDLNTEKGQNEFKEYFASNFEKINLYIQNLSDTVDDFRNFYKPNKRSVKIKLQEVISKSLMIIKSSLNEDNIKIIEDYQCNYDIDIYDNEMIQVILNILKNAQDNFKEKRIKNPQIIITTKNKSISICDNGGGIPENILENIFLPYFSTKDEKNGTGLGLYMCKTIIQEHHKGSIDATNTKDGVCFTIDLNTSK